MGVRRCKHGQSEIWPGQVRAEEDEELTGPRDDRPLPPSVRGCHCKGRRCDREGRSAHASKHIPRSPTVRSLSSLPSVACRQVGPAVCCGPSRSITTLSPAQQFLGAFGHLVAGSSRFGEDWLFCGFREE